MWSPSSFEVIMNYIYEWFDSKDQRTDISTRLHMTRAFETVRDNGQILVYKADATITNWSSAKPSRVLKTEIEVEQWLATEDRPLWQPRYEATTTAQLTLKSAEDKINPSHYQGYLQDLQWLEAMQYIPDFREPECFKAAIKLQVRKYMDRTGQKDPEAQETGKALWYLKFLAAYINNGNKPIKIADIETLLKK